MLVSSYPFKRAGGFVHEWMQWFKGGDISDRCSGPFPPWVGLFIVFSDSKALAGPRWWRCQDKYLLLKSILCSWLSNGKQGSCSMEVLKDRPAALQCFRSHVIKLTGSSDPGHQVLHWFERWCVHRRGRPQNTHQQNSWLPHLWSLSPSSEWWPPTQSKPPSAALKVALRFAFAERVRASFAQLIATLLLTWILRIRKQKNINRVQDKAID